jgi:hypothetical protein
MSLPSVVSSADRVWDDSKGMFPIIIKFATPEKRQQNDLVGYGGIFKTDVVKVAFEQAHTKVEEIFTLTILAQVNKRNHVSFQPKIQQLRVEVINIINPMMESFQKQYHQTSAKMIKACIDNGLYLGVLKVLFFMQPARLQDIEGFGRTPLHLAVAPNQHEIISKSFIQHILKISKINNLAIINIQDGQKETPLHRHLHCTALHVDIAKMLLEAGADPSAKQEENLTPLDVLKEASGAADQKELIRTLLQQHITAQKNSKLDSKPAIADPDAVQPLVIQTPSTPTPAEMQKEEPQQIREPILTYSNIKSCSFSRLLLDAPYRDGLANIKSAFRTSQVVNSTLKEISSTDRLTGWHRLIRFLVGIALLIPLVNIIIGIAYRCFHDRLNT